MGIINKLYDFMLYPKKMSNFPLMRRLEKFLFHNAILVYAGSLPQASPDYQRPLALLANSMLKPTPSNFLSMGVEFTLNTFFPTFLNTLKA